MGEGSWSVLRPMRKSARCANASHSMHCYRLRQASCCGVETLIVTSYPAVICLLSISHGLLGCNVERTYGCDGCDGMTLVSHL